MVKWFEGFPPNFHHETLDWSLSTRSMKSWDKASFVRTFRNRGWVLLLIYSCQEISPRWPVNHVPSTSPEQPRHFSQEIGIFPMRALGRGGGDRAMSSLTWRLCLTFRKYSPLRKACDVSLQSPELYSGKLMCCYVLFCFVFCFTRVLKIKCGHVSNVRVV